MMHACCAAVQADGTFCLVLEHCNRGSLDTLIHHFRTPIAHAPPPLPPPTTRQLAAAAAAAVTAADSSSDAQQEQQLQKVPDANLTRPDVPKMLRLMRGVARGLLHLHTSQPAILHRDIKPANICLSNGMQVRILLRHSMLGNRQGVRLSTSVRGAGCMYADLACIIHASLRRLQAGKQSHTANQPTPCACSACR